MNRKLLALCWAVSVVLAASALPANASAAELYSGSTKVPVGTQLVAKSIGSVNFKTGGGSSFSCASSTINSELVQNGTKAVKAAVSSYAFTGSGSEGRCESGAYGPIKVTQTTPVCLVAVPYWVVEGGSCGISQSPGLTLKSELWGTCKYGIGAGYGFSSTNEPIILTMGPGQEFVLKEGGFLCWPAFTMSVQYELKTAAGASLRVQ
jgi:hypothetical protein